MVKVDLITGFLGSGKTTFLKKYVTYLLEKGNKVGIIENDFGAVNVDALLLQDLASENCDIVMITGGCDKETHRRRFKTKLIAMGMLGYDRIVVEPSGIYDTDEFFDVFYEEPICNWYEVGNVLSMIDAKMEGGESKEVDYLFASELAGAGMVLCSRVDLLPLEERDTFVEKLLKYMNSSLFDIHCDRRFTENEILWKPFDEYEEEDFEKVLHCGYAKHSYQKRNVAEFFETEYFFEKKLSGEQLLESARMILEDASCGEVYRVKGYVQEVGQWYELNATAKERDLKQMEKGQELILIIGRNLNKDRIEMYLSYL